MNDAPLDLLSQTHPEFENERYEKRRLLFQGGEEIIDRADLFIPRISEFELDEAYRQKLAAASYTNLFASSINYYVSQTFFNKKLVLVPTADKPAPEFYSEFQRDADRGGTPFIAMVKEILTELLTHKTALIGVDTPSVEEESFSLHDEETSGADRAYLVRIEHDSLIDWELDDRGLFKWCRLKKTFPKPVDAYGTRGLIVTQFKVWTLENGVAKWELFERTDKEGMFASGDPFGSNKTVSRVSEGVTSFRQIPVLRFCLPEGLFLGGKISTKCADHFRMQSSLFYAQNRSLYAVPYYQHGGASADGTSFDGTDDAAKDAAEQALNRGMMVLQPNAKVGFLEPTGAPYGLINEQLKEMQDDVWRQANQMSQSVSATTQQSARSAASKQADNHSTEVIVSEYGAVTMDMADRIYTVVSQVRGESIQWDAKGLADYKVVDRAELLNEALTLPQIVSAVPSKEFQRLYQTEVALAVLRKVSPESERQIVREIGEATAAALPDAHPELDAPEETDPKEETDPVAKESDGEDSRPANSRAA